MKIFVFFQNFELIINSIKQNRIEYDSLQIQNVTYSKTFFSMKINLRTWKRHQIITQHIDSENFHQTTKTNLTLLFTYRRRNFPRKPLVNLSRILRKLPVTLRNTISSNRLFISYFEFIYEHITQYIITDDLIDTNRNESSPFPILNRRTPGRQPSTFYVADITIRQ